MARVTLQTIAERVGVSRMTVSNAFSRPDQLSGALRERILATAAELGYAGPDPAGRALARGSTGAVGILLTDSMGTAFRDDVATTFFGAVAEELAPTGLAVTLLPLYGSKDAIPARDVPIDGALVYACPDGADALDWLVRRPIPLVFVDREATPGSASVTLDDRGGAMAGAQHLVDLGHQHIGILTVAFSGPHGVVPDATAYEGDYIAHERALGWTEVLDAAGVRVTTVQVREHVEQDAYEGASLLLDVEDRPTAVLCFSDLVAWGVLRAASDLGLRVPQDVSVVGFDDEAGAAYFVPPLTTVRQDFPALGRSAIDALVRALAGEDVPRTLLPATLVVRASSAAPR